MLVLVSDASVLIELSKWSILVEIFELPFEFAVPDALFEEELIDLGSTTNLQLKSLGLRVEELDEEGVDQAVIYQKSNPRLSLNDCFAVSLAKNNSWPLITGDKRMKNFAQAEQVETYGCLWILDALTQHGVIESSRMLEVLDGMLRDPTTRIPHVEINKRILELS